MGDVLNHAALKLAMEGQDVVYANLTGEDLDIQANSVIAAMKACDVKRLIFVLSSVFMMKFQENLANGIMQLLVNP